MNGWTPERDSIIVNSRALGVGFKQIAEKGLQGIVGEDAVRRRYHKLMRFKRDPISLDAQNEAERALAASRMAGVACESDEGMLKLPVRPFEVPIPQPIKDETAQSFTAVLCGDMHAGFHDPKAVILAAAVARDIKPDALVFMGDGVDCFQISKYDRDRRRAITLQQDIDKAREMHYVIRNGVPGAKAYWLEGNHEERLAKLFGRMGERESELLMLRNVQRQLDWPLLLDLDGMGCQWVPADQQPMMGLVPKIALTHGDVVRGEAGVTAMYQMRKYGRSGASGHTHRAASFKRRDLNGVATWIETGCLCLLDGQPYGRHFNWQQGLQFIEWNADRRIMVDTFVGFRDGRAFFRSREYSA